MQNIKETKYVNLVCLTMGEKKNKTGMWYKALFLGKNSKGNPVTNEFFLSEEVGAEMVRNQIIENQKVCVEFGFDEFLRPTIISVQKYQSKAGTQMALDLK